MTTAPISLSGFFGADEDDNETDSNSSSKDFKQLFEVVDLNVGGIDMKIRQFSWHGANANQVWPGTFRLAEYISENIDTLPSGKVLELGAATGALSIYLSSTFDCFEIVTSDINDGGEVEENIHYNFTQNGDIIR